MNHTDHIFCHCHVHFTLSEYLNKHLEQYSSSTCRLVYISSWKLHILLHVSFFSQLYLWLILKSRRGEGGGGLLTEFSSDGRSGQVWKGFTTRWSNFFLLFFLCHAFKHQDPWIKTRHFTCFKKHSCKPQTLRICFSIVGKR